MSENVFEKWRKGLEKTRKVTFGRIANFLGTSELSDETWEELEALLIQADMGLETTTEVVESLRTKVHEQGLTKTDEVLDALREELLNRLSKPELMVFSVKPLVILLLGVNGSGKTTSAAKLAYSFKQEGKSVLLVAADTYRAAAIDQLRVWAERVDVPMVAGQPDGDPGAAAYDGISAALARNMDMVIIDTAYCRTAAYTL